MENLLKLSKLKSELYDKVAEVYGDEYQWIEVQVKMSKEKPKPSTDVVFNMNTYMIESIKNWSDVQGPKIENSGAIWDKSKEEKINS